MVRTVRSLGLAVVLTVLSHGASGQCALDERPPVEFLMREIQVRYEALPSCGSVPLLWPDCESGTAAPSYPPDGFYRDEPLDLERLHVLTQSVYGALASLVTCGDFVEIDLLGQTGHPSDFTFDSLGGYVTDLNATGPITDCDDSNAVQVIEEMVAFVALLDTVLVLATEESFQCRDSYGYDLKDCGNDPEPECDDVLFDAMTAAELDWATGSTWSPCAGSAITRYEDAKGWHDCDGCTTNGNSIDMEARLIGVRGKVKAATGGLPNGQLVVYLQVEKFGEPSTQPVPPIPADEMWVDGQTPYWRFFEQADVAGVDWISDWIGDGDPIHAIVCDDLGGCAASGKIGWEVTNRAATLTIDFSAPQDEGDCGSIVPIHDPEEEIGEECEGQENEGCGDGEDGPGAGPDNGKPLDSDPVSLVGGHKIETSTDLRVTLRGRDFSLYRTYSSRPANNGFGLVGPGWTLRDFNWVLYENSTETVVLTGKSHESVAFSKAGTRYETEGPATRYFTSENAVDLDGTASDVWRLHQPGVWEWDFYNDATSPLNGLPRQWRDTHGNVRTYDYVMYGPAGAEQPRLRRLFLNGTPATSAEAVLVFTWALEEEPVGHLQRVEVFRYPSNGGVALTQMVEYTYRQTGDGTHADTGAIGDLLQVSTFRRVDATESGAPFTVSVQQYRYHDGSLTGGATERLDVTGSVGQVKHCLMPEQIEYYVQKVNSSGPALDGFGVSQAAKQLLTLADDAAVGFSEGSGPILLADLAAKIVSYDGSSRVARQYLQSACGCGGATQGLRKDYVYLGSATAPTTIVTEHLNDGAGWNTLHQTVYHDFEVRGTGNVPYLVNRVVEEAATGRRWVTHYRFDVDGNITSVFTPSVFATSVGSGYTSILESTASPAVPAVAPAPNSGLIWEFTHTWDNRIATRSVREGEFGTPILIERSNYPAQGTSSVGQRPWLPDSIERFRSETSLAADDVEVTMFEYGFHDALSTVTPDLAYVRTLVEAELESENGPSVGGGQPLMYETVTLFDQQGRSVWTRRADNSLEYREYDESLGTLLKQVANANPSAPGGDASASLVGTAFGIDTTGWGQDGGGGLLPGGELVSTSEYDALGRQVRRVTPGGVSTYTRRELRSIETRPGVLYAATVRLPHALAGTSGEFNGPASVSWANARGAALGTSQFTIDPAASYNPLANAYTFEATTDNAGEISRRRTIHDLSGLVTAQQQWQNIAGAGPANTPYEDAYTYDALGRVATMTNDNGTVTEYAEYDVFDRVLEVRLGTTTDTPVPIARAYYDDPDPSDAIHDQGVGNGNLNVQVLETGDATLADSLQRVLRTYHDFRDRPTKVVNPIAPHMMTAYDNLDRVVAEAVFSVEPADIMQVTGRGAYNTSAYSQRGLIYRSSRWIDPQDGTKGTVESHGWFDARGRPIASWSATSPGQKTEFDAHNRPVVQRVTDRNGDPAPGAAQNHAAALSVTGDTVLEEIHYTYSGDDLLTSIETRYRLHDTSATGSLDASNSVSAFIGYQYDDADRRIRAIDFGSASANDQFESGGSLPPDWPSSAVIDHTTTTPAEYASALVEATSYNARGLVSEVIDPTGQRTSVWYDDLGRQIGFVENFVDATISWGTGRWAGGNLDSDADRLTSFLYDGSGNIVERVAHLPGGSVQATAYDYAASLTATNLLPSNDLLTRVRYPDETTGEPGASPQYWVDYAYNRAGGLRMTVDQNGTMHEYHRDDLGRPTKDTATPAGDIDDRVRAIAATFDDLGRLMRVESMDATQAVVNAVEYTYTPLWQVERVYQQYDGPVTGATPFIEYAYSNAPVASGNWSRVAELKYTGGAETIQYAYQSPLESRISRVEGFRIKNGPNMVRYGFVGMSMVAEVDYPVPDVQLDRTFSHDGKRRIQGHASQASGVFPGWDRFGRVQRHAWVDGALVSHATAPALPDRPPLFERTHSYDKASNRETSIDRRPGAKTMSRDFRYNYDGLHRLSGVERGEWDGSVVVPNRGGQEWTLDVLGNWDLFREDRDGDGLFGGAGDYDETRDHNAANELVDLDTAVTLPFEYDHAGNLSCAEETAGVHRVYVHDAWNRLVRVEVDDGQCTPGGSAIAEYEYNGVHWRTVKRSDTKTVPGGTIDQQRIMYYTASWQLFEEHIDDNFNGTHVSDRIAHQVWGSRYIDDSVCRRIRRFEQGAWGAWESYWYLTDVQFSVMAMIDEFASVVERVAYDAYGQARHSFAGDFNSNRRVDNNDLVLIQNAGQGAPPQYIGDPGYDPDMDISSVSGAPRDGVVNDTDFLEFLAVILPYPGNSVQLPLGWTSDPGLIDNPIGFCGYVNNAESGLLTARMRSYSVSAGRWLERDPLQYTAGQNLFEYVLSQPVSRSDPLGLIDTGKEFRDHYPEGVYAPNDRGVPRAKLPGDPISLGGHRVGGVWAAFRWFAEYKGDTSVCVIMSHGDPYGLKFDRETYLLDTGDLNTLAQEFSYWVVRDDLSLLDCQAMKIRLGQAEALLKIGERYESIRCEACNIGDDGAPFLGKLATLTGIPASGPHTYCYRPATFLPILYGSAVYHPSYFPYPFVESHLNTVRQPYAKAHETFRSNVAAVRAWYDEFCRCGGLSRAHHILPRGLGG